MTAPAYKLYDLLQPHCSKSVPYWSKYAKNIKSGKPKIIRELRYRCRHETPEGALRMPLKSKSETVNGWYEEHDADHCHCPAGCDHPQPFVKNGQAFCGRCWFVDHIERWVHPCDGSKCEDYA